MPQNPARTFILLSCACAIFWPGAFIFGFPGLMSQHWRLAFNAEAVDITDADSAGRWRELLGGAGLQRASLSGGGLFKDQASDALTRAVFFASEIREWQVVIPDFGTVTGPFQVTALEYAGRHDGEITFEIALESAGALVFAAV